MEIDTGTVPADGFEEALIGDGQQFNDPDAVYDTQKCLSILQERDGMSEDEAVEYFDYNVQGAYVGDSTPIFLYNYGEI